MSKLICVTIFVLSIIFNINETARILAVFPAPSISHQVVFRPLTQELAKRGHEVIVVTADPAFPKGQAPVNLTEIDLHDLSYEAWQYFLDKATGNKDDLIMQMEIVLDLSQKIIEKQVQSEEFQRIIKDGTQFDLLLLEACMRPTLGLSHLFKAPVIQVSSFGAYGNYEIIGAPTHPILYPSMMRQRLYNLTFWEKVTELYNHFAMERMYKNHEKIENEMWRRNFGNDFPSLSELANNVHMLLLNVHPIFEGNRPVPPSVIHMWGLHQKPEKELPQDMKSYLDSSKHGVIYMSFGSNVNPSYLPPEKIQIFVKVFSELPYDVLWKWDPVDELPGKSKNIRIAKWFPQSDLLRHPKIKLFVTQGGLQSTDEAITAGVPLIGIPMMGDQWYNTEKYIFHKIGEKLDLVTLTEEKFRNTVNNVIEDSSYRENIDRLRTFYHDQPFKPLDRGVWWIEHVIRHRGARHLRSPAANISWSDYLELPLVFTILICLLVLIVVFMFFLYWLIKLVSSSKSKLKIN